MDYSLVITERDSDNVGDYFSVVNGTTDHVFDLGNKIYTKYRKGSNIDTITIPMVWEENIPKIYDAINIEINRLNSVILINKTRLYEITHFSFLRVSVDETPESTQKIIDDYQSSVTFLKNYIP